MIIRNNVCFIYISFAQGVIEKSPQCLINPAENTERSAEVGNYHLETLFASYLM